MAIISHMTSPMADALQQLRMDPRFAQRITHWHRIPAQEARYGPMPEGLQQALVDALRERGMVRLYTHQVKAISAALRGEDVAVVTGAASGKTLCYNVPVLNALLSDPGARALYLFPTKTLAQDQLAAWQELSQDAAPDARAATYDGDTPSSARPVIRKKASILLTNPDMLHMGILPHHTKWQAFFSRLEYVVIDEMHAYRGVFGSHVANVLRRLRRVCEFYGARPRFICCSATIANPRQLAQQLVGRSTTVIDEDGSPRGERHFVLYNPPLVDPAQLVRRSVILEATTVADLFLSRDLSTIVFCRSRLATELLLTYLRQAQDEHGRAPGSIRGYRGGYMPHERRAIEHGLRDGSVRGVVCTNALELGVDIGELSACVLTRYPGTIASTWQQAGRAGRRQGVSAAVLIGGPSALDQYLLRHPQFLFGRTPEQALLAPDNTFVLRSHLMCAAFELPICQNEELATAAEEAHLLRELTEDDGVLRHAQERWYWMSSKYPARDISLRTAAPDNFRVCMEAGEIIAQVDLASAPRLIHPGAIYLHQAQAYLVHELDWDKRVALVEPTNEQYFTEAKLSVEVDVLRVHETMTTDVMSRAHGDVRVRTQATGYRQIALHTHEQLAVVPLDLPEQELLTSAYWVSLSNDTVTAMRNLRDWTIFPIESYGPNWERQRRLARERDGFRCRFCGRAEEPRREHDVHHKRPFRTFDYRPGENDSHILANALSNLITVCPECHPKAEASHPVQGTLQGLAHVLRALAPLYLMCDPRDLGVVADLDFPFTHHPTVVIYDAVPGGVGFSKALYGLHDELLRACAEWVGDCECEEGCPACIGAPPQIGAGAKKRVGQLLEYVKSGASFDRLRTGGEHRQR